MQNQRMNAADPSAVGSLAAAAARLEAVRERLRREPELRLEPNSLELALADGWLVLRAEVDSIAQKRRVLACARAVFGAERLVDEILVSSAVPVCDREIADHVSNALSAEPAFRDHSLTEREADETRPIRDVPRARGRLRVEVAGAVVHLCGVVPGLSLKRLAGALAWWVPGVRDVRNRLGVVPAQADGAEAITDAVRLVLEKDPLVDDAGIVVTTEGRRVRLSGAVRGEQQRETALQDAWFVWGVEAVLDELLVLAAGRRRFKVPPPPRQRAPGED